MQNMFTRRSIVTPHWLSRAKNLLVLAIILLLGRQLGAQTTFTVISPTGNGGFETSASQFPSNGWTAVQAATNKWNVGTAAFTAGVRGAYITNVTPAAGAANAYTNTANTSHIYCPVTIPAGATNVTLTFKLKTVGEANNWDQLLVWYGAGVPVVNTPTGQTTTMTGFTNIFTSNSTTTYATFQTVTVNNALPAGAANNLVFTWKNDGSGGANPPAAIDEVSLTYQMTVPLVVANITGGTSVSCGSTLALSSPTPSATGGTVTSSGNLRMNTFTASGTFTPNFAGNVEVMAVGGGGGGGYRHAGGGGAGGMNYNSAFAISGAQTVTVGAGGAGNVNGTSGGSPVAVNGSNGGNSAFGSLSATGGGGGGTNGTAGNAGGSGGGGSNGSTGGAGTAGQGNKGGNQGTACCNAYGAGGGGAGAAGANSAAAAGTPGGAGIYRDITGTVTAYAGGGGGGNGANTTQYAGGIGGGGAGGFTTTMTGVNGTANTGGGGGGGGANGASSGAGGNGGSGLVAVRYLVPVSYAWSSSNTAVATVNSSGVVSPVSNGTATITCTGTNGTQTAAATVNITVSGAPTADGVTVSDACWIADNAHDYTVTIKATGSSPTDIGGNTYGMLALVNYQGAHAGSYGGYYAWNTTTALLNASGYTKNQMACTGGGFVGMYDDVPNTFGDNTATLISASTSVTGNQRTVNFVIRPNATFPVFQDNSISMYAQSTSGCITTWVETPNLMGVRAGDPTVFGSSTWNVYAYEGQNRDNLGALTYKGYYTQNLGAQQGFNTQTAWANTLSPSNATTYLGCTVPADGHTFVHKRQGFTAGTYQITIDNWDDESIMYINGTEVWRADVWSGNPAHGFPVPYTLPSCYLLGASSTIEFRTGEGSGGSNAQISLTQRSAVGASLVPTNQVSCNNGTGSIDLTPSGGTGSYTYSWSTGATTQDISGLSSGSYTVTVTDQVCTALTASNTTSITAPWTANAGADQIGNCSDYTSLSGSTTPTLPTGTQTIFQENFDGNNGSVTTNSQVTTAASANHKWQIVNTTASTTTWWISNSANGFTCAIGGNSLLLKDGSNVKCDYQWDDNMTNTAYCNVPVNATGATNLNLKFDYNVGGERVTNSIYDYMSIVYSTNGTTWTALNTGICNTCAYNNNTGGLSNTVTNAYQNSSGTNVVVALPAALNNTSFYIGFRWNNDGSSGTVPGMVVDNISITADYPSISYTWSGPGTFTPNNTTQAPAITSPGTFTLSVAYNGCTSTDQVIITKETTAPTLSSCPASQTGGSAVNANASCYGTATWTAPSWTDNCLTQPTIPGATKITGVTSGNYYYVVPGAFTWAQAKADAIAKGGKLAVIENATENSQLATWFAANGYTSGSLWIGYTDEVTEGTYKTITGVTTCVGNTPTTAYGYTNWNAGEPNNAGGDEDYAEYIVTTGVAGLWNDLNSTTTNTGYILEFGLFQTAGLPPGCTYFPLGNTVNTYNATDFAGNTSSTCSFTVEVKDVTNPTITCGVSGTQNVNTSSGSCTYTHTGTAWNPTTSDNCSVASTTAVLTGATTATGLTSLNGVVFNQGTTNVTWTVKDGSNNQNTCSFNVSVTDNVLPAITTCPATQTVTVATNCQATIPNYATLAATPSTDNCTSGGSLVFSQSPAAGSYASYGTNSVTITVKDAANNQTSCVTNFIYTAPNNIVSTSSTNTCVFGGNNNGEKFLVDGTTNEALISINEGAVNLGTVTATVTKHGSVPAITGSAQCDAPAPSSGPVGGDELYLPREFDVTASTAPSGYVTVSLYFTQAELTALSNASTSASPAYQSCWGTVASNGSNLMLTIHHSDNTYETRTQGGGGLTIASTGGPNGTYKATFQVNKFSGFQFHGNGGVNGANGLPVQMLYFTANEANNTYVRLDWATALEINNDGFWVERSSDGLNWTSLAWIEGHDNSTAVNAYSYDDHAVASNILYYYRLKQVDNDGVFEYSGIETARLTGSVSFAVSEFIPNPTTAATHILITSSSEAVVSVVIYDLLGQKVTETKQQLNAGVNQLDFNFGQLAAGTYTATITTGNATYTKRVVLTK